MKPCWTGLVFHHSHEAQIVLKKKANTIFYWLFETITVRLVDNMEQTFAPRNILISSHVGRKTISENAHIFHMKVERTIDAINSTLARQKNHIGLQIVQRKDLLVQSTAILSNSVRNSAECASLAIEALTYFHKAKSTHISQKSNHLYDNGPSMSTR